MAKHRHPNCKICYKKYFNSWHRIQHDDLIKWKDTVFKSENGVSVCECRNCGHKWRTASKAAPPLE